MKKFFLAATIFGFASGCAITPTPLTTTEREQRYKNDVKQLEQFAPLKTGEIDIYEAMAMATLYNLDHRLKQLETVLSNQQLHLAHFDMLPSIVSSAGYHHRTNQHASRSDTVAKPIFENLSNSTSQDKYRHTLDIQFTYNILDFGISYINATQSADLYLISEERRRKMLQNIIRDVRFAYWKAYGAQHAIAMIQPIQAQLEHLINQSKNLDKDNVGSKLEHLMRQRQLYALSKKLNDVTKQLQEAQIELKALIGLGADTNLKLQKPAQTPTIDSQLSLNLLKEAALANRPELREEDYRKRITEKDILKAKLNWIPGIEYLYTNNYDSNSFLLNQNWALQSVKAIWNLANVISAPSAIKFSKLKAEADDLRRLALTMAIFTQVNVAYHREKKSRENLEAVSNLSNIAAKISSQIHFEYQAGKIDEFILIKSKAENILSKLEYDLAFADWQNTIGQLANSLGLDTYEEFNQSLTYKDLAEIFQKEDKIYITKQRLSMSIKP